MSAYQRINFIQTVAKEIDEPNVTVSQSSCSTVASREWLKNRNSYGYVKVRIASVQDPEAASTLPISTFTKYLCTRTRHLPRKKNCHPVQENLRLKNIGDQTSNISKCLPRYPPGML
jgi:hypothetical protein